MYKIQMSGFGQGLLDGMCTVQGVNTAVEFIAKNWALSITPSDLQELSNGCLHAMAYSQAVDDDDGIDIAFEPVVGELEACYDGINPNWAQGRRKLENAECIVWLPALVNGIANSRNAWMVIG